MMNVRADCNRYGTDGSVTAWCLCARRAGCYRCGLLAISQKPSAQYCITYTKYSSISSTGFYLSVSGLGSGSGIPCKGTALVYQYPERSESVCEK